MAVTNPKLSPDRARTTTTSIGAGDLEMATVAPTGYVTPQSVTDESSDYSWLVQGGSGWDIVEAKRSGNTLLRSAGVVLINSTGTTSHTSFGAGIKEVALIGASKYRVQNNVTNIFAKVQRFLTGFKIGSGDNLQITAWTGNAAIDLDGARVVDILPGGIVITQASDSADTGPTIQARRIRTSPNAGNLGTAYTFIHNDAGGTLRTIARVIGELASAVAGAATGNIQFRALNAGVEKTILTLRGGGAASFNSDVVVGKSAANVNNVGVELIESGQVRVTSDDGHTCAILNMNNGDGNVMLIQRDGSTKGTVGLSGETVTWGTFHGVHYSRLQDGVADQEIRPGTVMTIVDAEYDPALPHLPRSAICCVHKSRRVYGVFGGYLTPVRREDGEEYWPPPWVPGDYQVSGLGTSPGVRVVGPVEVGDLLVSSSVPGCAERQDDDIIRSSTIGKALRSDGRDGEKLVPAVIYAG